MVQIGNRTRHCPRSNGRAVRQPASERCGAAQEAAGGMPHYAECSQAHCSCLLLRPPKGFLSQSFFWMDDYLSSAPCSVPGCGLGPWSTQPLSDPGSSHGLVFSFFFFLIQKMVPLVLHLALFQTLCWTLRSVYSHRHYILRGLAIEDNSLFYFFLLNILFKAKKFRVPKFRAQY